MYICILDNSRNSHFRTFLFPNTLKRWLGKTIAFAGGGELVQFFDTLVLYHPPHSQETII